MSDILSFNPARAVDANGVPVPGARAFFYESGTSNPLPTYADADLTALNPVPLIADGSGFFPPAFVEDGRAIKVDAQAPEGWRLPGYPVDPVMRSTTGGNGAAQISFTPTAEIPETNAQKAIERVQANLSNSYQQYGLGVNADAPVIANLDLTNHRTGQYRYTGDTTGTFPAGVVAANGGIIEIQRQTASEAVMLLTPKGGSLTYRRALSSLVWGAWAPDYRARNGTASLPAYAAAADPDTGMFFPSANTIGWSAGGATRATLNPSQYSLAPGTDFALASGSAITGDGRLDLTAGAGGGFLFAGVTGGSANAKTITVPMSAPNAFYFFVNSDNTSTSVTLNVNGGGALPVRNQYGGAIPVGFLNGSSGNGPYLAVKISNEWCISPPPQYGSNAYGEYWRLSSGLQICRGVLTVPGVTTASGAVFVGSVGITFPVPFFGVPSVASNVHSTSRWSNVGGVSATGATLFVFQGASSPSESDCRWTATGSWF